MRGLLADVNCEGHVAAIVAVCQSEPWRGVWDFLRLEALVLSDFGLLPTATDREIWNVCQSNELILITGNRNNDGQDSLQALIQSENSVESMPILTFANLDRILIDEAYRERVAIRLLDYVLDIEDMRGSGRLFLP